MKRVCITWHEAVHDGLGGVHPTGSVVALPDDLAQVFVDKGRAKWADDINPTIAVRDAKKAAAEREAQAKIDAAKAHAVKAMALHDSMPAEVRAEANERGGDVAIEYLNKQIEAQLQQRGVKKSPKEVAFVKAADGDEVSDGFDEAIAEAEAEAAPKRKRGRPRKTPQ